MDEAQQQAIVDSVKVKVGPSVDVYSIYSESADEFFVHRRTNKDERRIYRDLLEKGSKLDAQASLMSCVLYPEPSAFVKKLEDAPFVVEILENAILAASGIYVDAQRKKW